MLSFQDIFLKLQLFWSRQGCLILQPYDMEMGAATFHPKVVFGALEPNPISLAFVQPCRRPGDGRYGQNPNRLHKFHQFQVLIKPTPDNIRDLMLESFEDLGIDTRQNDIRFVEDDWESPTLGATGLGWEVWLNGMEVLQFTYFQKMGGLACSPVCVELAYGLERLALGIQKKKSLLDIAWNHPTDPAFYAYGGLYQESERTFSTYAMETSQEDYLQSMFIPSLEQGYQLLEQGLIDPAYEMVIRANHAFNMLNARGLISVSQRADQILKIRELACACCRQWVETMGSQEKET